MAMSHDNRSHRHASLDDRMPNNKRATNTNPTFAEMASEHNAETVFLAILPAEVRVEIYRYTLQPCIAISNRRQSRFYIEVLPKRKRHNYAEKRLNIYSPARSAASAYPEAPLLRVCSRIRKEALPIFWSKQSVTYTCDAKSHSYIAGQLETWLNRLGEEKIQWLTRVNISMRQEDKPTITMRISDNVYLFRSSSHGVVRPLKDQEEEVKMTAEKVVVVLQKGLRRELKPLS